MHGSFLQFTTTVITSGNAKLSEVIQYKIIKSMYKTIIFRMLYRVTMQ